MSASCKAPIGGQFSSFCVPAGQSSGLTVNVVVAQAPIINAHAAKKMILKRALYVQLLMGHGLCRCNQ